MISSDRPGSVGFAAGTRQIRRSASKTGGARRDRTDDLMLAKHALSQLSYGPMGTEPRRVRALGAKRRKAERPPRLMARAKRTDVRAGA